MSCANCGGRLDMKDQSGATKSGSFEEDYECANCGANGYIRGDASDHPQEWRRFGRAFDGGMA